MPMILLLSDIQRSEDLERFGDCKAAPGSGIGSTERRWNGRPEAGDNNNVVMRRVQWMTTFLPQDLIDYHKLQEELAIKTNTLQNETRKVSSVIDRFRWEFQCALQSLT